MSTGGIPGSSIKRNGLCVAGQGWYEVHSTHYLTAGQWCLVTSTWDGSVFKIYINGELSGSNSSVPAGFIDFCPGGTLRFGIWWRADLSPFQGVMDDVRIYNQALSAEEVWELYQEGLSKKASSPNPADKETSVDSNVILSWKPGKDALSHDIYFGRDFNDVNDADIYDSNVYMGNQDVNYWDVNNYDTNGLEPGTTFYWRIDEVAAATTKGDVWSFTTKTIGIDPNLVAWWKFDEGTGTVAYDSAGSNNGQLINGPVWTSGYIDGGLSFDGVNDYVDVPDNAALRFTKSDSFSVCSWVNPVSGWGDILCKMQSGSQHGLFTYEVQWSSSSQAFDFALCNSGNYYVYIVTPNGSAPPGSWYHVAWVYQNKNATIYINGELKGSGYFNSDPSGAADKNVTIGVRSYGSAKENYFNGTLDDVRIYNKVLSAAEIEEIYQNGL
jgi:hypothetical protein